jgi:hypothetical protein
MTETSVIMAVKLGIVKGTNQRVSSLLLLLLFSSPFVSAPFLSLFQQLGVAFVDSTLFVIDVCEFLDNDKFSNFESVLVQRGAKECILAIDSAQSPGSSVLPASSSDFASILSPFLVIISPGDYKKLHSILDRCGVPVTEKKTKDFKTDNVEQDLTRLVGSLEKHFEQLDKKQAMAAGLLVSHPAFFLFVILSFSPCLVACLVKYCELMANSQGLGKFKLQTLDLSQVGVLPFFSPPIVFIILLSLFLPSSVFLVYEIGSSSCSRSEPVPTEHRFGQEHELVRLTQQK